MKNSKVIIPILILAALGILIFVIVNKNNQNTSVDYYVSLYAPNSLAYFNCKSEGLKDGNLCSTCEDLFTDADKNRASYSINSDADLVDYVGSKNKNCINLTSGGN